MRTIFLSMQLLLFILLTPLTVESKSLLSHQYIQDHFSQLSKKNSVKVLPNGLTIVCHEIPDCYKVYVGITYNVGAKNEETPQEFGFAHAIEHMIFKGTKKMSETDMQAIVEKFGVGGIGRGYNAFTSYDTTHYYFLSDKNNWPMMMNILADSMANASFKEEHFASEVKAIFQEIKMNKANPVKSTFNAARKMLFHTQHPYHHPIIGYKHQLIATQAADLKKFYHQHYQPSNATLFVIGDIKTNEVIEKAQRFFGSIPYEETPLFAPHLPVNEHFESKDTTIYLHLPSPFFSYFWRLPASKDTGVYEISNCVDYLLQEKLTQLLVDEKKLADDVHVQTNLGVMGSTLFIFVEPSKQGIDREHIIKQQITQVTQKLCNCVSVSSLEQFKNSFTTSLLATFESTTNSARFLDTIRHKTGMQDFSRLTHTIEAITPGEVKDFCLSNLQALKMNTVKCLPIPKDHKKMWKQQQLLVDSYDTQLLAKKQRKTPIEAPHHVYSTPSPKMLTISFTKPDTTFRLSNGLLVHTTHKSNTPFIHLTLQLKNQEFLGLYLAKNKQLYEHKLGISMLEEVDGITSKYDIQKLCEKRGIGISFGTDSIDINLPKHLLQEALKLFSVIMENATYPASSVNYKVAALTKELTEVKDDANSKAHELLKQHLFGPYPWLHTIEEKIAELSLLTRKKLLAFKNLYIRPNNMVLTVLGNLESSNLQEVLEKELAWWQPGARKPHAMISSIPSLENPAAKIIKHQLPQQQVILFGGRIIESKNSNEALCLRLLDDELNKLLFEIRERTGLFYTCHASLHSSSFLTKGAAKLKTLVSPHLLDKAQNEIQNALTILARKGITKKQLIRAKRNIIQQIAISLGNNKTTVNVQAYLATHNQQWHYFDELQEKINAITVNDVNDVARKILDPTSWTFVHVGRVNP